jgi:hypothetical protein
MSTLTETVLEYRLRGLGAISSSGAPTDSSTGTEGCGCADFDRNRLRRCGRSPALGFRAPSSSSAVRSATDTVLDRLLRVTGRLKVELRREGADDIANKFDAEVFVRGFVNLVGGLRGASADCVFPILLNSSEANECPSTKVQTYCRSISPHMTREAINTAISSMDWKRPR